ncbi:hypothetical protein P8605_42570, partial [Streptomyces sp. T-3]|nr:hypothetical protein [Streptomyces sp. T-3]
LACALGGVMSGGIAQRVADWLDGGGTPGERGTLLDGPPVLLSWQAAVIPLLLVVVVFLVGLLCVRTLQHRRLEIEDVPADYPDEPLDTTRTRRIAGARARAALTDHAPVLIGIVSAVTLALGLLALVGAWGTAKVPGAAFADAPGFVRGAAQTAQALGSWAIG